MHLVSAVQTLSRCRRLRVFGSSALLVSFPELGESGGPLEVSYDADLLVEPCDEGLAAVLNEAVGEGSLFAEREGYFADFLRPEIVSSISPGWEQRTVPLPSGGDAAALSAEDLAVVKLRVGRQKDLDLCRCLLERELVVEAQLRDRLQATPMQQAEIVTVYRRLRAISIMS